MSDQAGRTIGDTQIQAAWVFLGTWILATGFRPDLVRSTQPSADLLAPLTTQMTPTCAASFTAQVEAQISASSARDTDSIESLTSIGITAPGANPLGGEDAVTDRAVSNATADLDAHQDLAVTVHSSGDVHFTADHDRRFHSTVTRDTTYTLVRNNGRWLVDAWQGTWRSTDPIDD